LEYSSEFRLLIASGILPLNNCEIEHLQLLCSENINWGIFIALVERHRLLPTVYRNLSSHALYIVPDPTLSGFKQEAELNRRRILRLLGELSRISKDFDQEGIQLCALKGPLLAQRLYGDASLRTSVDLDLLVYPEDVEKAELLLMAGGYKRSEPAIPLTSHQRQMYIQKRHDFAYYHPQRHIEIELHWAITSIKNLVPMQEVRQMLSRTKSMAFAGPGLHVLSDEDLPVNLLIHGSKHSWLRLKWLVDFVVWMRQPVEPDWEELKQKMENLGLQRMLGQGVLLANWLFDLPIPEPVQEVLEKEKAAYHMAERSLKFILNDQLTGEELGKVRHIFHWMELKKDLGYKWNVFTNHLLVPEDWVELPLPDSLYPLYILLRPFLGLKRIYLRWRGTAPEDFAN